MNKMLINRNFIKDIIFIILLLLITNCIFSYTVKIRQPWFDTLSGHRQSSSATALLFIKNWCTEGAVDLKFAMLEIPASVEYSQLAERNHYFSYPPGAILPVYLITKLLKIEPTLAFLMKYNLANHFLIAFFLSLAVYVFLLQIKLSKLSSFLFSLIPVFMVLLLPAPLYWFQNTFIFLQAVILPYVLYVFLEILRDASKNKKIIDVLQIAVFFYGVLVNWIFIFIAMIVYIKRILSGEIKRIPLSFLRSSILFWLPAIITILLLLGQIAAVGNSFSPLVNSFTIRTGLTSGGDSANVTGSFYSYFWKDYISKAYGSPAIFLFFASLIILAILIVVILRQYSKRDASAPKAVKIMFLTSIFLFPGFIYVYIFREWAAIHDVSVLYLIVPFATVPFVLMPVLFYVLFKDRVLGVLPEKAKLVLEKNAWYLGNVCVLMIVLLSLGYSISQHKSFRTFFPVPNGSYREIGEFIGNNTGYNDIVFSPDYGDALFHPQLTYYSGKTIHKIKDLSDIFDVTDKVGGEYIINIFSMDKDLVVYENGYWELNQGYEEFSEGIEGLENISDEVIENNGMHLYKIKPEVLRMFVK